MKFEFGLALFALFFVSGVSARTVDVFILTGQSNSLGTSADKSEKDITPGESRADKKIRFFWSNRSTRAGDGTAALIGDSGGKIVPLQEQQGEGRNPVFWGPEVGFGRGLYDAGMRDFLIIKASRGGGGNGYWLKGAQDDHMYRHIVSTVKAGLKALPVGTRIRIRAMLYVQGESDRGDEAALAGARLATLAENLRKDLPSAKEMQVVVGGIAAAGARRDVVRARQAEYASGDVRAIYIDTLDLQGGLYDRLHFNKASKLELGQRMAVAWKLVSN